MANNGGPAFPMSGDPNVGFDHGMSLTDYFAGQALLAIARSEFSANDGGGLYCNDSVQMPGTGKTRGHLRAEQLARMATDSYELAAAMLTAKQKFDAAS